MLSSIGRLGRPAHTARFRQHCRLLAAAGGPADEHAQLTTELERIKKRLSSLEAENPSLARARVCTTSAGAAFARPRLHHINLVAAREVGELHSFYRNVLHQSDMPASMFPRTAAGDDGQGFDGKIAFTTDGAMQLHLAERDLTVAFKNGQVINPIEAGHIAFRTDDIEAFKRHLEAHGVAYSDYGTAFAQEWHQIFFHDPEGTVVEVHAVVA